MNFEKGKLFHILIEQISIFRCDLCDYKGLATNTNVVSALLANHKKMCHKEEYEFGQRVFVQGKMRIPTPLNILSP